MGLLPVVLLALTQVLCFAGLAVFLRWLLNAKQREIEQKLDAAMRQWLESPEEGKPSKLAELLYTAGQVVGQSAANSIMRSLDSDKGHIARVANGVADGIEGSQNPILGLLSGGKRGKGAAVKRLGELLMGMFSGGGGLPGLTAGPSNGSKSETQQRIEKGG